MVRRRKPKRTSERRHKNKYADGSLNYDPSLRNKCENHKKKFPSREAAQNFCTEHGYDQYPYKCKYCGLWHLSTQAPKHTVLTLGIFNPINLWEILINDQDKIN